jgi:hypothetical protein
MCSSVSVEMDPFENPFRPGAGTPPPALVGRDELIDRYSVLIQKGMVYSPAHGDTAFTVPMFDDFLRGSARPN